jgi:hypothetical protein
MDYQRLCAEIQELDPQIRFVGVCNGTGEAIHGGLREGLAVLLSYEETKKSNLLALERGTSTSDQVVYSRLSSLFDGVMEIEIEEKAGKVQRKMRLTSSPKIKPKTTWTNFEIDGSGKVKFVTESQSLICSLCKAPILDEPKFYSELAFHAKHRDLHEVGWRLWEGPSF